MNPTTVFLAGIALTGGLCLSVVGYLRESLKGILVDLCGTESRAKFWGAVSHIILVLVPLAFAMGEQPHPGQNTEWILQLSSQLKSAFVGSVLSVALIGAPLLMLILTPDKNTKAVKS